MNERGVPIIANTADNTLNLAICTVGKQTVYAYSDSTLVGKLCIQAYDVKEVKVHVVRVNNGNMPSVTKLQSELNEIFSQAVVKLKLDELEQITIKLDHKFKHGGTRRLRAYNDDQRKVVDELKNRAEYNADDFYLFFIDDIERLDDEGNPTNDLIGGYMPVGWHFGFIYNNPKIAYIAHELGHGTLTMHHTFSDETETFSAPKESTDNLMDYKGGSLLNHTQWQWAHESHGREWFEEEEDGEMILNIGIMRKYLKQIHDANSEYKESLVLNVSEGINFAYGITIELEDSVKLSYLSMSTYKNSSSYSSIKPYEKATKVESDSLTTYTFNAIRPKFGELPPISFTIKTDEKQVFEDYLYGKDIDISDKVQWVSQFDENIFGKCDCWTSACCRRACEYMLGNTNIANCEDTVIAKDAPYKTQKSKIVLAYFSDNTKKYSKDEYNSETLIYDKNKIDEGFNYIKNELQAHRPVLIGVHQTNRGNNPPNNKNRATCHWMIVVGIGMENGVKYIRFFDPGRKVDNHNDATSVDNKLKYDSNNGCYSGIYRGEIYTLTEIIKY
jgi:Ni,Fe-hydrogenase III component G